MRIDEDWERESYKDYMYRVEHQMYMEAEWQEWEEELNRLPAKIKVLKNKLQEHENNSKSSTVRRANKEEFFTRSNISSETN